MTTITPRIIALPPVRPTLEDEATAPRERTAARERLMNLPFLSAGGEITPEVIDPFRMLANFQDVIDAAADAGLIDDEAAVVFHRQLIAWSRATTEPVAPETDVVEAAYLEAAEIIERARQEVAQIRSLTLTECDEILATARAAAERIVDDAVAHAS